LTGSKQNISGYEYKAKAHHIIEDLDSDLSIDHLISISVLTRDSRFPSLYQNTHLNSSTGSMDDIPGTATGAHPYQILFQQDQRASNITSFLNQKI